MVHYQVVISEDLRVAVTTNRLFKLDEEALVEFETEAEAVDFAVDLIKHGACTA